MDIAEKVLDIIRVQLGLKAVAVEQTLYDLGCDDLDILEIIMACEETFEIEIADEQVGNCGDGHMAISDLINICKKAKETRNGN